VGSIGLLIMIHNEKARWLATALLLIVIVLTGADGEPSFDLIAVWRG
jgi:hypothetical protein